MTTGTPLDLTPFGSVLSAAGALYWTAALVALAAALYRPGRWFTKAFLATLVVLIFGAVPFQAGLRAYHARKKIDAAMARFEMHCKDAGEKINHVVENVDGVVWMKWRDKETNYESQFKLNDPYGHDCDGTDCIQKLLRATDGLQLDPQKKLPYHRGYRFVESVDPTDGQLYRYTLRLYRPAETDPKYLKTLVLPELVKQPIQVPTARYGVTWDDISTHEDREEWLAGSSLKVIDLQTKEVIAERVGYMVDKGQGSQEGFRSPWLYAVQNACPEFPHEPNDSRRGRTLHETADFVLKVLHQQREE